MAHDYDTNLDRAVFLLDDEAYAQFIALLEAPPEPTAALRALMTMLPPWDEPNDRFSEAEGQ